MSFGIDTECLFADFDAFLHSMESGEHEAGTRLAARIHIFDGEDSNAWPTQFSPMVLLYPELQCASLGIEDTTTREANLAHLCFLIHAFVEDRILDGQIELDREEACFIEAVSRRANDTLKKLGRGSRSACGWTEQLIHAYVSAQNENYECIGLDGLRHMSRARVRRIASGRGYLGALIPMALASHAGANVFLLRRIKNAFDALMLGLQWLDDFVDWPDDIKHGDINLVLSVLREVGPDPYAHPANTLRQPNIAHALLERDLIRRAARYSKRWLRIAQRKQEALGCVVLARQIGERHDVIDPKARNAQTVAEEWLLAQLAMNSVED